MPLFLLGFSLLFSIAHASTGIAVLDSAVGRVELSGLERQPPVGQAFKPSGLVIETGDNGLVALVFSNGLALAVGPNTQLTVEAYSQVPFTTQPDQLEFEPSRSQLTLRLDHGKLGLANHQANPLSEITIELRPEFVLQVQASSLSVEYAITKATIAPLAGRTTIDLRGQQHLVTQGYRFQTGVTGDERIRQQSIEQAEKWATLPNLAELARQRWYFDSPENTPTVSAKRILPSIQLTQPPFNNTKL